MTISARNHTPTLQMALSPVDSANASLWTGECAGDTFTGWPFVNPRWVCRGTFKLTTTTSGAKTRGRTPSTQTRVLLTAYNHVYTPFQPLLYLLLGFGFEFFATVRGIPTGRL